MVKEYHPAQYQPIRKPYLLPPGTNSLSQFCFGFLHLQLGKFLTSSAKIDPTQITCKFAFLGQTINTVLKPTNAGSEESQICFDIHCSLWHFHKYLQESGVLVIALVEGGEEVGRAELDLPKQLDRQLYDGVEPLKEFDGELEVRREEGRLIGTLWVNVFTKFNHEINQEIKHLIPELVKERRRRWLQGASKKERSQKEHEPSKQVSKQPDKQQQNSQAIANPPAKPYDNRLYLEPILTHQPITSQAALRQLTCNQRLASSQVQFYTKRDRSHRDSQPRSRAEVVPTWLKHKEHFKIKIIDLECYHPNLEQSMLDKSSYLAFQIPGLAFRTMVTAGELVGDIFKFEAESTLKIKQDFKALIEGQTAVVKLMLRQQGRELEVGRGHLPMQRIVASQGDGLFTITILNRVPLSRILLKSSRISQTYLSNEQSRDLQQFPATEIGRVRVQTQLELSPELLQDDGKRIALYSKRKLFQMLLEIYGFEGGTELAGNYFCKYKLYGSSETMHTAESEPPQHNFRHRAVIPLPPELLLRMEGTPFVIELWHKHHKLTLQGIVKVDLKRLPKLLLTKERIIDEDSPCLHDVHPVILQNGGMQVSNLNKQSRGSLYVILSFGTVQQIQRFMDGLPAIRQPATAKSSSKPNHDYDYERMASEHDLPVKTLEQLRQRPSMVDTSVMVLPLDHQPHCQQVRESVPSQAEEEKDCTTTENEFLQVRADSSLADTSSLSDILPQPIDLDHSSTGPTISQTALYLDSLSRLLGQVEAACPHLKEALMSRIKDQLQFGFVETKRLTGLLVELGLEKSLIDGVIDIVDCRRQGLSFLTTLWDYLNSCQVYGSVTKLFVDLNALSFRLIAHFRSHIRAHINDILVRDQNGRIFRQAIGEELSRHGVYITEEELELVLSDISGERSFSGRQLQGWACEGRSSIKAEQQQPKQARQAPEDDELLLLSTLLNRVKQE